MNQQIEDQEQEIKKLNDRIKAVNAARVLGDDAPEEVILENVELLKDCAWDVEEGHRAYACIIGLVEDWKPLFKKQVWGYLNDQDKARIKQIKAEYDQYVQKIIDYEKQQQNLNTSTTNKTFDKPAPQQNNLVDLSKAKKDSSNKKMNFGSVKVESPPPKQEKTIGFGTVKIEVANEAIDGFGAA